MADLINLTIDGRAVKVPPQTLLIDAAKTVKPALASFYSSLSGEQKARFNRIGQQLSAND